MKLHLLRHLVLKDVRHQGARLVLIWLMAYFLPLSNLFFLQPQDDLFAVAKSGVILLFCLLLLLSGVSAVLLDPTSGSDRFLLTRPVGWATLLLSKILFVLLFLWIPVVIFRLGIVWTAGVPLSYPDQAIYIFETTLFLSALASLVVLPAFFFRRLTTVILTLVGFFVGGYILALVWSEIWNEFNLNSVFLSPSAAQPNSYDPRPDISLRISSFLVVCGVILGTMVTVGILRYWKPTLAIPVTLVFAGLFLSLTYWSFWSYPLDQFASDAPVEPVEPENLSSDLRDQIRCSLQDVSWDISRIGEKIRTTQKKLTSSDSSRISILMELCALF
jgi:hypothetical protein